MGVLNVTPDSFFDGATLGSEVNGQFRVAVDRALRRAEAMVNEGAAIIDVGGESTRPGASPVSIAEELERVMPVIEAISRNLDTVISIDTSSPEVMTAACRAGAGLINDVRALRRDGAMSAAANSEAAVCLMHTRAEPNVMQQDIHYEDVVEDILEFLMQRVEEAISAGISREKLLIDPGFGFGKTVQHNYRLLRDLNRFAKLQLPILVGLSRKSMIGNVVDRPLEERLAGTLAATTWALANGASIVRTHDVAPTVDIVKIHCAVTAAE
ncbi:MAG: dihydropteroate synthase [Gammaproteobacteria bacterium]|nr:dihydropteroate synthase [Gammaproteobacteria bacterium]